MIGNSHIGCIKLGWDEVANDFPDTDLRFFASAGDRLREMEVRDSMLAAPNGSLLFERIFETSGGKSEIVPSEYDAFFIIGGWKIWRLDNRTSSAVLKLYANETITGAMCCDIAFKIRSMTDKPIFVGHNPLKALPAGTVAKFEKNAMPYRRIVTEAEKAVSDGDIKVVRQPEETRSSEFSTLEVYAKGSRRLRGKHEHPDRELSHMNSQYGRIYTSALLKLVQFAVSCRSR